MSGAVQSILLDAAITSLLETLLHANTLTAPHPPPSYPNLQLPRARSFAERRRRSRRHLFAIHISIAYKLSARCVCGGKGGLDVTDLRHEVVELLLGVGVFLRHLLVLLLPRIAVRFEGLHFALVVPGFDVGLA